MHMGVGGPVARREAMVPLGRKSHPLQGRDQQGASALAEGTGCVPNPTGFQESNTRGTPLEAPTAPMDSQGTA